MTSEFSLPQSRACPWLTNQTPCVWYMLLIQEVMICIFSIQYTSMGVGGQHTCEDCGEHIFLWDVILLFSTAISLMWVRPSSSSHGSNGSSVNMPTVSAFSHNSTCSTLLPTSPPFPFFSALSPLFTNSIFQIATFVKCHVSFASGRKEVTQRYAS